MIEQGLEALHLPGEPDTVALQLGGRNGQVEAVGPLLELGRLGCQFGVRGEPRKAELLFPCGGMVEVVASAWGLAVTLVLADGVR